jgi:hypothetical protein
MEASVQFRTVHAVNCHTWWKWDWFISEYLCLGLYHSTTLHSSTNITLFYELTAPLHNTLILKIGHPHRNFQLLLALCNTLPTTDLLQCFPIHFNIKWLFTGSNCLFPALATPSISNPPQPELCPGPCCCNVHTKTSVCTYNSVWYPISVGLLRVTTMFPDIFHFSLPLTCRHVHVHTRSEVLLCITVRYS